MKFLKLVLLALITIISIQVNSQISVTSEFPYGYSLKMGRICHYYFENISYNYNIFRENQINFQTN